MKKVLLPVALCVVALLQGCDDLPLPFGGGSGSSACPETPGVSSHEATLEAEAERRFIVYFDEGTGVPGRNVQALRPDGPPGLLPEHRELIERRGGRIVRQFDDTRAVAAWLSDGEAEALRADSRVRKVEVDPKRYPLAQSMPWGMELVQAPAAWAAAGSAMRPGVKTCIIDSGLYPSHEDLPFGSVSGYPEDWNADACGHGTHVAGTLAALDNDVGVVGASPLGADLFVVRVFGENCGWSYASELADAVRRCADAGARVVNMSLGGDAPSEMERDAFAEAWRRGLLLVAAAGNAGGTELEYPASYPTVLSVGAVDGSLRHASFSQRNEEVDLVAPGVRVLSTFPFVSRHEVTVGDAVISGTALRNAGTTSGITGPLVDGGLCAAAGDWTGRIVLCRRGTITFAEKVLTAQAGGAAGAVVYNNSAGTFAGTLGDTPIALPAIGVSGEDGAALLGRVGQQATLVNEPERPGSGYAPMSGTSMAAPHVAGIASFVWGQAPDRSNAQVREALLSTAQDLGPPGRDDAYGHGLVRADRALAKLREGAPPDGTPIAGFLNACEGLRCDFADASFDVDGQIEKRAWDFGDGHTALGASVTHHFERPGPHVVSLEVQDDGGRRARKAMAVSAIAAEVRAGPPGRDGTREVTLTWQGAAGDRVLVLRDGEVVGSVPNAGAAVDRLPATRDRVSYRICTPGGASCSTKLFVLPACR